jgi:DNA-binding XRE family transcriptional regulator
MGKLANYLTAQRIRANLTQQEAADEVGLSQPFLCHIERGRYDVNIYDLFKLCRLYGCSYRTAMQLMGEDVREAMEKQE